MRLAAIVLAAGRSRRFGGGNKLLSEIGGSTVLRRTVTAVTAAGYTPTLVVTGPDHATIAGTLSGAPVRLVPTAATCDGLGFSIAAGMRQLAGSSDGVLILPGDMPLITPSTLGAIGDVFRSKHGSSIVFAADANGQQRNPVVWPRRLFPALAALQGPHGAKALIDADAIAYRVMDANELFDIDDPSMLETARRVVSARPT